MSSIREDLEDEIGGVLTNRGYGEDPIYPEMIKDLADACFDSLGIDADTQDRPIEKEERKIVQIAVSESVSPQDDLHQSIAVLCNDGTVWSGVGGKDYWHKLPPIPQPKKEDA